MAQEPISRILVSENSLSLQECTFLIRVFDRYWELTSRRDYNDRPLLDYYTLREVANESASRLHNIAMRCKEKVALYFGSPVLFIESFFVACLFPGDSHIPHADNERREERQWVPNHTPQRDYTEVAYLNDDFSAVNWFFQILIRLSFRDRAC
jgi:hypothetical protein